MGRNRQDERCAWNLNSRGTLSPTAQRKQTDMHALCPAVQQDAATVAMGLSSTSCSLHAGLSLGAALIPVDAITKRFMIHVTLS